MDQSLDLQLKLYLIIIIQMLLIQQTVLKMIIGMVINVLENNMVYWDSILWHGMLEK